MSGQLKRIFTAFRSYPNGASTLASAIEKALSQCSRSVRQYGDAHGAVITAYDAGWYTDRSEKNIHYQVSWPERDVVTGHCICAVGSRWAEGIVPTRRLIKKSDGVLVVVICLGKRDRLLPSSVDRYMRQSKRIDSEFYIKVFPTREYWVIGENGLEKYGLQK